MTERWSGWIALLFLGVWAASAPGYAKAWSLDSSAVRKAEARLQSSRLPETGAAPLLLSDYVRYYAAFTRHGHRMMAGELLERETNPGKAAGFYLLATGKDFPQVDGGGCSVVHVLYDIRQDRLVSLTCNGAI